MNKNQEIMLMSTLRIFCAIVCLFLLNACASSAQTLTATAPLPTFANEITPTPTEVSLAAKGPWLVMSSVWQMALYGLRGILKQNYLSARLNVKMFLKILLPLMHQETQAVLQEISPDPIRHQTGNGMLIHMLVCRCIGPMARSQEQFQK
jgi:hypothetical protein